MKSERVPKLQYQRLRQKKRKQKIRKTSTQKAERENQSEFAKIILVTTQLSFGFGAKINPQNLIKI